MNGLACLNKRPLQTAQQKNDYGTPIPQEYIMRRAQTYVEKQGELLLAVSGRVWNTQEAMRHVREATTAAEREAAVGALNALLKAYGV